MREKSVRTDLLLDFYGNLLTPKMRRTCESYYNDDLTLAEIAEAETYFADIEIADYGTITVELDAKAAPITASATTSAR